MIEPSYKLKRGDWNNTSRVFDTAEKYRAIFAFDLAGRMRDIKVKKTLVIEVRVPEETHLSPQGANLLKLIPNSRLVTLEHTSARKVTDAKAEELAAIILGFRGEVRSARTTAR